MSYIDDNDADIEADLMDEDERWEADDC